MISLNNNKIKSSTNKIPLIPKKVFRSYIYFQSSKLKIISSTLKLATIFSFGTIQEIN